MDMRIHQEMSLGIGGVRLLRSLGLRPTVYHMNEGHSAFLSLERIRQLIAEDHLTYDEALQVVQASQLFTTHTPVPAGIDLFPADKVTYYVGHYAEAFNLSQQEFLSLGRVNPGAFQEPFSLGGTLFRPGEQVLSDSIPRADQALYQAKHGGRDRWVWA